LLCATCQRGGVAQASAQLGIVIHALTEPRLPPPAGAAPTLLAVDTRCRRLEPLAFTFPMHLVAWPPIAFISERDGSATIMCAMCLAGLVAGRIVGVPGRVLVPVALGLMVVLWMVWIDPPASSWTTTALAHAIGGALVGWALVEAQRHRIRDWRVVALVALSLVIVLTLVWELGEYAGDQLFDTSLIPNRADSAEDILFGTVGGLAGITFAGLRALWRSGS
jgi:hypothetical protein